MQLPFANMILSCDFKASIKMYSVLATANKCHHINVNVTFVLYYCSAFVIYPLLPHPFPPCFHLLCYLWVYIFCVFCVVSKPDFVTFDLKIKLNSYLNISYCKIHRVLVIVM